MSFGLQKIFDDVTIQIKENEKVRIIGVNGAGKSTFLKLIMGKLEPDKGKIILKKGTRIGFLPQVISDEIPSMDITVFEYLMEGRPTKKLELELSESYLEASCEEDEKKLDILMKKISNIQEKLDYYEVYKAESILLKIIDGINIDSSLLDMKLCNLSGGQKSKIAFARLLYSKPEIILLDEPTNHLDTETQKIISDTFKDYEGTMLVVSHNPNFVENLGIERMLLLPSGEIKYYDKNTVLYYQELNNNSKYKNKKIV